MRGLIAATSIGSCRGALIAKRHPVANDGLAGLPALGLQGGDGKVLVSIKVAHSGTPPHLTLLEDP